MTGRTTDFELLAQMSAISYERNPSSQFDLNYGTSNAIPTDFNLITSDYGSSSSFGAQAYYSASDNRLVIAYQGSQEFTDWTVADAQILAGYLTIQDNQAVQSA